MAFKLLMEVKGFDPDDEARMKRWMRETFEEAAEMLGRGSRLVNLAHDRGDPVQGKYRANILVSEEGDDLVVNFEVLETIKEPDRDVWAIGSGLPEDD